MPGLDSAAFCPTHSAPLPLLPPEDVSEGAGGFSEKPLFVGSRRKDGRLLEEMRPIHMQTLSLGRSSGSAFVSIGNTKVYCAVFGPRSAGRSDLQDRGHVKVDYRGSPFFDRNPNEGGMSNDRNAMVLHQALDSVLHLSRYPKSIIEVCVMVLEDDGGSLAAALTCAGLALADAGVEAHDVLTGASAYAFSYQDESGASTQAVCLDLDSSEYARYSNLPDFTAIHVGFCPALASICCLQCRGPLIAGPCGEQLFSLCEAACAEIGREVRRCLQHSFAVKEQQIIQDISIKRPNVEGTSVLH